MSAYRLAAVIALAFAVTAGPTAADELGIGVYALSLSAGDADPAADSGLGSWLAAGIAERVDRRRDLVASELLWPLLEAGRQVPVSYPTLLAAARGDGVHGFVVATVTLLEVEEEEAGRGVADRVSGRIGIGRRQSRRRLRTRIAIEGGLVDARTGEIVAPLSALAEADGDADGASVEELLGSSPGSTAFDDSPLREAAEEALDRIADGVVAAAAGLSASARPEDRPDAPAGLRFVRSTYEWTVPRGPDRWVAVEVLNPTSTTVRFVLRAEPPPGMVADFMGAGSRDRVAELAAGAWKTVRLVLTTDWVQDAVLEFPVRLYEVADGIEASDDASTAGEADDTATVVLRVDPGSLTVSVEPLGETPGNLARRYRLTNAGNATIADLRVRPADEVAGSVWVHPAVDHLPLDPGASIEVSVGPRLYPGFTGVSGTVLVEGAGGERPLPVAFELPAGHAVYRANGDSVRSFLSSIGFCTNTGGKDVDVGGPYLLRDALEAQDCDELAARIADYQETRDLFDGAPDAMPRYGDAIAQDVHDYVIGSKGPGASVAGTTDPDTAAIDCDRGNFGTNGAVLPYADWDYDACIAHETRHQSHVRQADEIEDFGRRSDWTLKQMDDAMRDHYATSEVEAYDVTLSLLRAKYAENCGGSASLGSRPAYRTVAPPTDTPRSSRALPRLGTVIKARLGSAAPEYFLGASFELAYGRDTYTAHDTEISLNGHPVATLADTVPEGRYVFPVSGSLLDPDGGNSVELRVEGMNGAHYIVASELRLYAPVTDADRLVVATSQEAADRIYREIEGINHGTPDIVLVADPEFRVQQGISEGDRVVLGARALNLSDVASAGGRLRLLNQDPRAATEGEPPDLDTDIGGALTRHVSDRLRLRDVGDEVAIPALGPFESVDLAIEFEYRAGSTTRLWMVAEIPGDFDAATNFTPVTFVAPDLRSPLLGTDYPDLGDAPFLSSMVRLPSTPDAQGITAVRLGDAIRSIPYLEDVGSAARRLLDRVRRR